MTMDLKTRREHAERFINLFIVIVGVLAACLFIERFFFDDTSWMQPLLDRVVGLAGWEISTIVAITVCVVYVLLTAVCWLVWLKNAVPMDDEMAADWDGMMRKINGRKKGTN